MTKQIKTIEGQLSIPQMREIEHSFTSALQLVDEIVLKNYLSGLRDMPVIPLNEHQITNSLSKMRLFKITEMVYAKDESATYKFASVFSAVAATNSAIVTIIDSDGIKTDFYLGIRALNDDSSTKTAYSALVNAMQGHFPGAKTENLKEDQIKQLVDTFDDASIATVSCVANNKNKEFINNDEYLQGLEKLALAMQGNKYTAVIIANSTTREQLNFVRQGYENIYTQLSPFANVNVSYGKNTSETATRSETTGTSESNSTSNTRTYTSTDTETENVGEITSKTEPTLMSKAGSVMGSSLALVGGLVGAAIAGPAAPVGATIGSSVGAMVGTAISAATNKTITKTQGGGSKSHSNSSSTSTTDSNTTTTSQSVALSLGLTSGSNQNLQLNIQNKPLVLMLDRIDKQLERLSEFESIGMWECATYFMSKDSSVSKVAASTYKALMSGENSGLEVSAINTWTKPMFSDNSVTQNDYIAKYVRNFMHPLFRFNNNGIEIPISPTMLVSGNELAIHMGLPRHSVCGFPVIEHSDFGKEVVRSNNIPHLNSVKVGNIYNMGREVNNCSVDLDVDSLAMHTFVVGATGSGKSNTIYTLLDKLTTTRKNDISFMVIEPAKGEYKRFFGHKKNVKVFGTNPEHTALLKINPFKFSKGIHVLEHIDRLIEIFNVCWPMYAAMPAVLKEAMLASYYTCGWDLETSNNNFSQNIFPTFKDLLNQLVMVIQESDYSEEVKSNYIGSLCTRIKSLTNGLNGQIFSSAELDNTLLFDTNVIIDLSRVGSQETKALIMGILVMRLTEHRMCNQLEPNSKLRHVTVLEEAHNILGSNISNGVEGTNISGKAVEMLSNSIAEMRTYGEGFIIADQSPGAVDISAIRNTNTKIIMRLPEESDRKVSGKAAALKENQIDEISRLPQGVAVIYQSNWLEPVLCKIDKFEGKEAPFELKVFDKTNADLVKMANSNLIKFILRRDLDVKEKIDVYNIARAIDICESSGATKAKLYLLLEEYKNSGKVSIWEEDMVCERAAIVASILNIADEIKHMSSVTRDELSIRVMVNTMIAQKVYDISDELLCYIREYLKLSYE